MRNTASLSEIVGEFKSPGGVQEVRATAEGTYNEDTSQLLVKLGSSVLPFTGQSNLNPSGLVTRIRNNKGLDFFIGSF